MTNIKYYPRSYTLSEELMRFFTQVTNDQDLQAKLNQTKTLAEVSDIAVNLGFKVRPAEILQAQAGRVLAIIKEQPKDVHYLLCGKKAKTGAQWGRGGKGYLDNPGYWLMEFASSNAFNQIEKQINAFLESVNQNQKLQEKLLKTDSINELSELMKQSGFNIQAIDILSHQAQKILALSEDTADQVALN